VTAPAQPEAVEVPAGVTAVAAGRPTRAVWRNELGGLTFQLGTGNARQFVKWSPAGNGIDLSAEVVRLRWAAAFTTVPQVIDEGSDEIRSWFVTLGLPGRSSRAACARS
jgi:aminoglycoside phosphotransferase